MWWPLRYRNEAGLGRALLKDTFASGLVIVVGIVTLYRVILNSGQESM